jgi:fumarate hydratase subunit beta
MITLRTPFQNAILEGLTAGDAVLLTGGVYTARDAAHRRIADLIGAGAPLPFDLAGAAIYYVGPCPAKPGQAIGSCGPTSAVRMDAYAPLLFDRGVKCTIAKGPVSSDVAESIRRNRAVYLCATGGIGALLSQCVLSAAPVAFEDLGSEAVQKLEVKDMPLIVGIDGKGGSLFR